MSCNSTPGFRAGRCLIEFWTQGKADLVEIRPVDSVDVGTGVVTLSEAVANGHALTAEVVPLADVFTQLRGSNNTDGGTQLLGSGALDTTNVGELTEALQPGLTLGIRVRTSSLVATRRITSNYKLRRVT